MGHILGVKRNARAAKAVTLIALVKQIGGRQQILVPITLLRLVEIIPGVAFIQPLLLLKML